MTTSARSLNFQFLGVHGPKVEEPAAQAERLVWIDAAACVGKVRMLAEVLAAGMAMRLRIYVPGEAQADVLRKLDGAGALSDEVREIFHAVRKAGNAALHENRASTADARAHLRNAWHLALWFHRGTRAPGFVAPPYAEPPDPSAEVRALATRLDAIQKELAQARDEATRAKADADAGRTREGSLRGELEDTLQKLDAVGEERATWESLAVENEERLKKALLELEAKAAESAPEPAVTLAAAQVAGTQLDLSEAETRALIDAALRAVGWEVDTPTLTYARGARPQRGKARAIAEWPTEDGIADYVLFDGTTAVAVIEAKRLHTDVPGALEQARRYARAFRTDDTITTPAGGPWEGHRVPLLFATNGRAFMMQLPERSGIHLHDVRRAQNHPRVLAGWYSPEGVRNLLAVDVEAAHARLAAEPTDYLGLRDYQLRAIAAVEKGLGEGRRHLLVAMATGTGKTRTCLGLVYRLIKARRFRRVLFLVDRTVLGEQTLQAFREAKLEGLRSFHEIFEVKGLRDLDPEPGTRFHVATVQGMIRRILFAESIDEVPAVDRYDCIVVDECHRGYALDREMSEAELSFRDERDYLSKYRRVLDHFDAVRVGLTATPALHTTDIFGRPVFEYRYKDAVLDGWLIDHDVPYAIDTKLATRGIHFGVGERVAVYNRSTATEDYATLPDEVNIELDDFHRKVVTESYNRVVCEVIAREIDPTKPSKTLVFCVDDAHADLVVRVLKECLDARHGPQDDATVAKITGRVERTSERIRRFRNESLPKFAVTVDLLTTGVDVPPITNPGVLAAGAVAHLVRADARARDASLRGHRQDDLHDLRRRAALRRARSRHGDAPRGGQPRVLVRTARARAPRAPRRRRPRPRARTARGEAPATAALARGGSSRRARRPRRDGRARPRRAPPRALNRRSLGLDRRAPRGGASARRGRHGARHGVRLRASGRGRARGAAPRPAP